MEEYEKINIRSEEVQEILGTPPRWIVQWGTTIACVTFFMILFVSWLVDYPDVIKGPIQLTSIERPVPVVARQDGYIEKILVVEGDSVIKGQAVAVIQNEANYEDIKKLDAMVATLEDFEKDSFVDFIPEKELKIGSLQVLYLDFLNAFSNISFTDANVAYDIKKNRQLENKIAKKSKEIMDMESAKKEALTAWEDSKQQFAAVRQDYTEKKIMDVQKLYDAKEIEENLENKYNLLVQKIKKSRKTLEELKSKRLAVQQVGDKKSDTRNFEQLKKSIQLLRKEVDAWQEAHYIISPASGTVSLYQKRSERQFVQENEEIMSIVVQRDNSQFVGEVRLPLAKSGKVLVGQTVNIKFDSYPYQEFGIVKGQISKKDYYPKESVYFLEVKFPNGLMTTYEMTLKFEHQLSGTAEIITENRRFIQRVFDQCRSLVEN